MSWHTGPLALFDLETTGVDPHRDRIVTAALIEIRPGQKPVTHEWLLDPGIPIPEGAQAVHGISTDFAAHNGRAASTGVFDIASTLLALHDHGVPIVGHNVT